MHTVLATPQRIDSTIRTPDVGERELRFGVEAHMNIAEVVRRAGGCRGAVPCADIDYATLVAGYGPACVARARFDSAVMRRGLTGVQVSCPGHPRDGQARAGERVLGPPPRPPPCVSTSPPRSASLCRRPTAWRTP